MDSETPRHQLQQESQPSPGLGGQWGKVVLPKARANHGEQNRAQRAGQSATEPSPTQSRTCKVREGKIRLAPVLPSPSSLLPLPPGAGHLGTGRQENLGAVGAVSCHRVSKEAEVGPRQTGRHLHRCSAEDSQDMSPSGKNQSSLGKAEGNQGPESHREVSALLGASSFSSSCNRWASFLGLAQPHSLMSSSYLPRGKWHLEMLWLFDQGGVLLASSEGKQKP